MSLAHAHDTVPAFPLGQPIDGRMRFSMHPRMALIYRFLVDNRPHDKAFRVDVRVAAKTSGCCLTAAHKCVQELVVRGWLKADKHGRYRFVEPVMRFPKVPR